MLRVGDRAPDFRGLDQNGDDIVLAALLADGPVVLYFYPKDFTAVCTKEACLFRDAHERLVSKHARVVGISVDDDATHRRFAAKHTLPYSLVADPGRRIASSYGVVALFGLRILRVTYAIDREQRIRGVFHHELSAQKHLDDVERVLATL